MFAFWIGIFRGSGEHLPNSWSPSPLVEMMKRTQKTETELDILVESVLYSHLLLFLGICLIPFLPAGRAQSAQPAGPKITVRFPRLLVYIYIYICASALITCAIITSCTLLPCNLARVDFDNLDGCFV